jgi:hypothetical protein
MDEKKTMSSHGGKEGKGKDGPSPFPLSPCVSNLFLDWNGPDNGARIDPHRSYAPGATPMAQPESRAPEPWPVKRFGSHPASRSSAPISFDVK